MTMKLMPHLFGVGLLLVSVAAANAKPAYVASTVNFRAAPGTSSEILGKIPGGSLIDAGECSEGWCAVTWEGKSGFAIQTSLDLSGRVPQRQAARPRPGVYPDDGYVPEEDAEGPYYEPPAYYVPYGYYRPYYGGPYWGYRRWHLW
jgi:uncharacterized protein YgiM (DUF1202 family)